MDFTEDCIKLNDDWINNFEKIDKLYQDFYKDDLYYINLKLIYVNRNSEIEKVKQESFLMSKPSFITREEMLQILKKSTQESDRMYSLLSILRYNNTLEAEDIENFIIYPFEERNFLKVIKHIDEIKFEKTISMFQDLNDLIFIFYEKSHELKKTNPNSSTKKIYLHSNTNKKTIKKRYKE
jgi:hypothetical protein